MKRQILALGSCLAITLTVVGCQEQPTSALAPATRAASTSELEAQSSLAFGPMVTVLPSLADEVSDLDVGAIDRIIKPSDYVCSSSSPINDFINAELGNTLTQERARILELVNNWDVENVPYVEALLIKTAATPQTYGYDGEFTHTMIKTEREVKNFWASFPSNKIQVVSMRGDVLFDVPRLAATYNAGYGIPYPTATEFAQYVHDLLVTSKTMNGNYAYWTFNAVSSRRITIPTPGSKVRDTTLKVIMGDGILEAYKALGLDDVAPQAIFAHEFAHQIQFLYGYQLPPAGNTGAERTRYTELMADAFSAYYLTHARGATLRQKRVEEFNNVFFYIGDCSFSSSGHHGTPNQRRKAAQFGFTVADEFQKQGHILTPEEFFARFQEVYPTLIAPDAH